MIPEVATPIKSELTKHFSEVQKAIIDALSNKIEPISTLLAELAELQQKYGEMHRQTTEALVHAVNKSVERRTEAASWQGDVKRPVGAFGKAPVAPQPAVDRFAHNSEGAASRNSTGSMPSVAAFKMRNSTGSVASKSTLKGIVPAYASSSSRDSLTQVEDLCIDEDSEGTPQSAPTGKPSYRKSNTHAGIVRSSTHDVPQPPGTPLQDGALSLPDGDAPELVARPKKSYTLSALEKGPHVRSHVSIYEYEDDDDNPLEQYLSKRWGGSAKNTRADATERADRQRKLEAALTKPRLSLTSKNPRNSRCSDPSQPLQHIDADPSGSHGIDHLRGDVSVFAHAALRAKSSSDADASTATWEDESEESAAWMKSDAGGLLDRRPVFADADALKEKLRLAIVQPKYDVANFYWDTGCCQRVARSAYFENTTLLVIAFNAIWLAVDVEHNDSDMLHKANAVFQIAEHFFCTYFTVEWSIRFLSFRSKKKCLVDAWFVFDSILVTMMILETWVLTFILVVVTSGSGSNVFGNASIMRLVRLLRLTRMARMAKLLVAMPELSILIKGLFVAFRSVAFTLFLLLIIVYIFSIAFTQLLVDTDAGQSYFNNIADSMLTLLVHCTLIDGLPKVVKVVGKENYFYGFVLLVFVLLASLTVMNMLIGILCEVVTVVSAVEKENSLLVFVKARLQRMLTESGLDADGDGMITKDEFEQLLDIPEAARALQEVGVDVIGLVDFADFIFGLDGNIPLTFADFMDVVLQLRGSNGATVKDMVDMRKFITQELSRMEEALQQNLRATLVNSSKGGSITRYETTSSDLSGRQEPPQEAPVKHPSHRIGEYHRDMTLHCAEEYKTMGSQSSSDPPNGSGTKVCFE